MSHLIEHFKTRKGNLLHSIEQDMARIARLEKECFSLQQRIYRRENILTSHRLEYEAIDRKLFWLEHPSGMVKELMDKGLPLDEAVASIKSVTGIDPTAR